MGDHSSRRRIAPPLKRPTRVTSRNRPICHPYSVLHQVGFAVPPLLPAPRCALAAPFRPYRPEGLIRRFGGMLSVALSLKPWPEDRDPAGRYPAPSFRGARTFLGEASLDAVARSPDERRYSDQQRILGVTVDSN